MYGAREGSKEEIESIPVVAALVTSAEYTGEHECIVLYTLVRNYNISYK